MRLRPTVLSVVVAHAIALAPLHGGAADEPGHPVRVTVDGGRVSIVAEAATVEDIARALTERTGVEIGTANAHGLTASLVVEREPLERAIERVVRAVSPVANAATVFTYDGDRLRAVKILFRTAGEAAAMADHNPEPLGPGDAGGPVERSEDVRRRAISQQLRAAGVPAVYADDQAVQHLAEAGVSLSEILEHLKQIAAQAGTASPQSEAAESSPGAVVAPLTEVERQTLTDELRAAGIPHRHLEEGQLLAARQLRSDGVPLAEIADHLRAISPPPQTLAGGGGTADTDAATHVTTPSVTAEAARILRGELRQAGVSDHQLDESSLIMAQQLRVDGVAIDEIRDNLAAIQSTVVPERSETDSTDPTEAELPP
jgi:hypothetical protein